MLADHRYGLATLMEWRLDEAALALFIGQMWAILRAGGAVILLISALSLVGSVVAGLRQRSRELAVIRAVGSSPVQTTRQIVLEGVLLGLASSLMGVAVGWLLLFGLFVVGVGSDSPGVYAPLALYGACLVGGPVLAVLAGIGPAARAAAGSVAGALRRSHM